MTVSGDNPQSHTHTNRCYSILLPNTDRYSPAKWPFHTLHWNPI